MKLFDVYPLFEIEPVRGHGCFVYDKKGTEYLDFYGGHAVISIGHAHPHFVTKISEQLHQLNFYSNSVQNSLQQQLAKKLGTLSGCSNYQLFLCNSGAEANENALKLASFQTGKKKIIAFDKAFHGRTSAAVNITDKESIKAPINKTFETEFLPLNDLEALNKAVATGDICAIIIEGIQGIGGIHIPQKAFLEAVQDICQKHNIILILDEIQSGYGRSGKFFAFQHANIQPDLITIAKGMGNGFPIGGVLISDKFEAKYGLLGTTFGGNHLACTAGIAVLDVIQSEYLMENAETLGNYFKRQLETIIEIKEIRGHGLMIGCEFNFPIAELRKHLLYEEKTFTGSSSDPNVMRLLPPLNIHKNEVDLFIERLQKALSHFSLTTADKQFQKV